MSKFNKLCKLIKNHQNSLVAIPEDMKYPGWQTDRDVAFNSTPLMLWIEHRKDKPIPTDMYYSGWQTDRDRHNSTPLMLWIEFRKGAPIPEEFKYTGWQTDRETAKQTPLMLWIKRRQGESIPEELKYPNWRTDRDKYENTPLMLWIQFRQSQDEPDTSCPQAQGESGTSCLQASLRGEPIPDDLKYPNWQTDRDDGGQTPLMSWIQLRQDEPIPEDMKYPNWQTDKDDHGCSPQSIWINFRRNQPIPEEMKYEGWERDGPIQLLHLWIQRRKGEPIPEDLKYPGWQSDKDMYGQTPIVRWFAYRLPIRARQHRNLRLLQAPYGVAPVSEPGTKCLQSRLGGEPVPEDMFYDGWEDAKDLKQRGLIEVWKHWTDDKENEPDIITQLKMRM